MSPFADAQLFATKSCKKGGRMANPLNFSNREIDPWCPYESTNFAKSMKCQISSKCFIVESYVSVEYFLLWQVLLISATLNSVYLDTNLESCYPPGSEASRGVFWNQAQKNFTHTYTEYPWVSVTLSQCNSVTLCIQLKTCPNSHHLQGGLEICTKNFTFT